MTDEDKEMKEWIEQRRKGSDLMSKLLIRNEELQKENEELKAFESHWEEIEEDAKVIAKENEELKAEIENLKKTYRKQRNKRIDELQKENAKLKEQIEKMKCCLNCKNNTEENCLKCSKCYRQLEEKKEGWFDNWELAE